MCASSTDPTQGISVDHLKSLDNVSPDAAVFISIDKDELYPHDQGESDTDSGSEDGDNAIPETLTSLFQPTAINEDSNELKTTAHRAFEIYKHA